MFNFPNLFACQFTLEKVTHASQHVFGAISPVGQLVTLSYASCECHTEHGPGWGGHGCSVLNLCGQLPSRAFVLSTCAESVWLWPSFSLSHVPGTDCMPGWALCLSVGPDGVPRPAGGRGPGEDLLVVPHGDPGWQPLISALGLMVPQLTIHVVTGQEQRMGGSGPVKA